MKTKDRVPDQHVLGKSGEAEVAELYVEQGYEILQTGFRCRGGEIDIIAEDADGTVVFVEVKTRRSMNFGAAEAVTAAKLQRMRKAAAAYLQLRSEQDYAPVRFDVVEVIYSGTTMSKRVYRGVDDGAC